MDKAYRWLVRGPAEDPPELRPFDDVVAAPKARPPRLSTRGPPRPDPDTPIAMDHRTKEIAVQLAAEETDSDVDNCFVEGTNIIHDILDMIPQRRALTPAVPQERHPRLARKRRRDSSFLKDFQNRSARVETGRGLVSVDEKVRRIKRELGLTADEYVPALDALSSMASSSSESTGISQEQRHHAPSLRRRRRRRAARKNPRARTEPVLYLSPGSEAKKSGIAPIDLDLVEGLPSSDASEMAKGYSCNPFSGLASPYRPRTATNETSPINLVDHDEQLLFPVLSEIRVPDLTHSPVPLFVNPYSTVEPAPVQMRSRSKKGQPIPEVIKPAQTTFSLDPFFPMDESEDHVVGVLSGISPVPIPPATSSRTRGPDPPVLSADFSVDPIPLDHGFADGDASTVGLIEQTIETVLVEASVERLDIFHYGDREGIVFAPMRCVDQESDQNEQYLSRWWDRLCREDEGAPAEKTDLSGGDPFLLNCCWFCPVSNPANVATTTDVRVVPSPVSEVLVFPDADGMSRITSEDEFEVEVGDGAIVVSGGNDVRYLGTLVHRLDNTVHTDHFDLLVEVSDGHKAEMTDDVDLATRSTQTSILASPVVDEPCRHAHQQVKPCSWGFFLVPVFSFSPCAVLHSRRDAVGEDIDVSNVDADQIVDVARKVPHQCVFPEPIPCQLQPSTRALYLVDSSSDEAEPHQPNELSLSPAAVCSSDSTVKLDNRASATLATTLLPEYMSHSIIPRSTTDMEFGKPPRSFQEEGLSEGDEELLSVDDIAHVVGESIHISSTGSEAEVAFDEAVSPDATMGTKKELSDPVQASFISFQPLYPELPELRDEVSSVNKEADDANTSSSRTTTCSGAAISPSAIVTRDQPTCEMEEHEDSRTAVDSPVVSMAATQSRVERVQCQVSESAVPGFTPAELDCIEKPGVTSVGLDTSDSAGDPVGSSFLRPIDLISEEGFMHGEREYIMVAGRREPSESEAGLCSEQATAPQTHVRRTSSSIISPGYQSTRVDGLPRKHHRTTTFVQPTGSSRCTFENYEPSVVNDDRSDVVGAVGHEKDEQRDDSHGSSDVLLQGGRRRTPCGRDRLDALRKDMEFARRTLNRRLATLHVHSEPQSEAAVEQDIVRRAQKLADQSSVLFFKPVINFYQGTPPLMEALPTPVASSSQRLSPVEDVGVNETDEVINVSSDLENDVLQKLERRDNYVEAVAEQRRQPCVCTSPRPDLIPLASGQLLPTGSVVSARAAVDTSRIGESDGRIEGTCRSFESVPVIEDTATQSDCDVVELDESTLACDEDFHIDPSLAEKFAEIEEALDSTAISLDAPDQDESFDDDLANELDALEAAETSLKRDLDLLHLKRESLLYVSQRSRSQGGADMNTRTPLMSESTVAFPLSGPVLESQSEVLSPRTSQTPSAYDPTVVDNMEASLKYPIADPKVESSNSRQRDVVELRSPSSTEMDTDTDISIYSEHVRMAPVPEKHTGEVDAFLPRGRMRFDSMSSDSGSRDSDVIVLGDGWRDAVELYLRSSYDDDSVESEEIEIIFVEDSFMSTESFSYGELKGVVFDWIRIQDAVVSSLFEVDSDAVSKRGEQTTLRPRDEEETHSQCVWRSQLPGDVLDPRVPVTLVIRDTGAEDKQTVESRPLIQSQRQQVVDLGCFKGAVDDAIDRDLGHQSRAALCENRVEMRPTHLSIHKPSKTMPFQDQDFFSDV